VSILSAYPVLFVLAGVAASTLLTQRALALMSADAKAALIDSSSSTRIYTLIIACLFVALLLWRPLAGWAFLGSAYLGLGVRSFFRLRRLSLPPRAAHFILMGNVFAVGGIALCALIFTLRALN
jgi:hypothetical protein